MFRRKWSGLPEDHVFPEDLEGLGYFINEQDEVRNIKCHDEYYKYFLSKSVRVNDCQRFAMNGALQAIIYKRLEDEGLEKVLLPLGTTDLSEPHAPIFVSRDIKAKQRVVVIFGDKAQDLGILAHRVVGGPGGVDKGSMVSVVRHIKAQAGEDAGGGADSDGPSPSSSSPGIVLANSGQLWWWPAGRRVLNGAGKASAPMKSAVHWGAFHDEARNEVPGNESCEAHIRYIFEKVLPKYLGDEAKISLVGVADAADDLEEYLNQDGVLDKWADRIDSFAIVAGTYLPDTIKSPKLKELLKYRSRAYALHKAPAGTLLAGPQGNSELGAGAGCPTYSSGTALPSEMCFVVCHAHLLDWMKKVAADPGYRNPEVLDISYVPAGGRESSKAEEPDWSNPEAWENKESHWPKVDWGEAGVQLAQD